MLSSNVGLFKCLSWSVANSFTTKSNRFVIYNIVAAFRGMHVSPAKHSYTWLPRKCDYRTDTQTDRRRTKWSLCAVMLRRQHIILLFITYWQQSEGSMCLLPNIAMRDNQESVTTGQTHRGRTKWSLCTAMLCRQHKKGYSKHSYTWLPRNIHVAMRDFNVPRTKKVWLPDRHTDGRTDRRRTKWSLCAVMLHRRHKTVQDYSVIYAMTHRCAGGLKRELTYCQAP